MSEIITEAKLSRYWQRRAKSRARRNERKYPNKIDRAWALKQQTKWNKTEPELEAEYLKEIDMAQNLVGATKGYIEKIKQIREKRKEEKKKSKKTPYKKSKVTKKFPFDGDRTGGVAKVYQKRSKRVGGSTIAPGESFGPSIMEAETVKKPLIIRIGEACSAKN